MEKDKTGNISKEQLPIRQRVLGNISLTPIEIKEGGFFVDKTAFEQERQMLSDEILTAADAIVGIPGRTQRDMDRWVSLEQKLDEIHDFRVFLANQQLQMLNNPSNHTLAEISNLRLWDLANLLSFRAALNQLRSIAKNDSIEDKFIHLSQLLSFDVAPGLSIRLGQVSIQDFLSFNRKTTEPVSFYQYLVEAQYIRTNNAHEQVLEQNQQYPYNKYPNHAKRAIDLLPGKIFALTSFKLSSDTSPKNLVSNPTVEEARKHRDNLMSKVQDVREVAYKTLLNPTSRGFSELSQLVQKYLESEDINLKLGALGMILSGKKDLIIEAYRKSRKYEREKTNEQFYATFADSIGEYIEEASPFVSILTDEDIVTILDTDKIQVDEEKGEPTFEELGKTINAIVSKTSNRNFDVNTSDIDWSQLHMPEEAQVHFDIGRPRKFTLMITFNNDLGESTEVECAMDTVKNFMDWNHPEDPMLLPKNSDLIVFRRSLLLAAQSILDKVYQQAQEEYQSRQASNTAPSPIETIRPKRERVQDPVYELRRTSRRQQQEQESTNILFDVLSSKEEIKNRVILPSDEEFEDMVRYLSHVDRDIVRKSIEEYNEKGTGAKFARKRKIGTEGEVVYGLSIGCSVPKGARVLLRETESEVGIRNFEIIDIRYRKDIYPKNKL